MGRMYIASVLLAITGKTQPAKVAEVELEPIVPGAWAAWAKDASAAQSHGTAEVATAPSAITTTRRLAASSEA